jgi:formylmethanofuran dehydrogenase subunit E
MEKAGKLPGTGYRQTSKGTQSMKSEARKKINGLLKSGDLTGLLEITGELHGHFCPGVALGVKAGYLAMKKLGTLENLGMEELLAVVECNNCFVDGIQMATGCSFGNNALIYKDFGKTAFTLIDRNAKRAVRVATRPRGWGKEEESELEKKARELREKVVGRREGTEADALRLADLWKKRSFATLDKNEGKLFSVEEIEPDIPAFAPLLDSQICHLCGESVMESKAVFISGKPACIPCAGIEYRMVAGKGIHPASGKANR